MSKIRAAINVIGALLVGFILTTLVVAAFACGSPEEPNGYSATGSWLGNATYGSDSLPITLALDLVDREGVIQGTGTLSFSAEEVYYAEVDGLRDQQVVSLNLVVASRYPVSAQGSVVEATLTLTLTGSGFAGERVVLTRQASP